MVISVNRLQKILSRTQRENNCLVWQGCKRDGYGLVTVNNKSHNVHRLLYAVATNSNLNGLVVDHLCRNRACVNINHLEAVSNDENLKRGLRAKTHCINGHPYSDENVRISKYTGHRYCRPCQLKSKREYQRRVYRGLS